MTSKAIIWYTKKVLSKGECPWKHISKNIPKEVSFSGNSENLEELIRLIKKC